MAGSSAQHRSWLSHDRHVGFTLTELLIASALSLVIMGAVAGLFGLFGRSVRHSQATADMGSLMRSAAWQLRQDLTGVTCPVRPGLSPEQNAGYFELIEGPERDVTNAIDAQGAPTSNLTADTDDILLFTTQSLAGAFVGRYQGQQIESPYAEVAWFCRPVAAEGQTIAGTTLYNLHRRQSVVVNYLGRSELTMNVMSGTTDRGAWDISLRSGTVQGQGVFLLPNSLGDLTKREHRFLRSGYSFVTKTGAVRSLPVTRFPHAFPVDATSHAVSEAGLEETRRAAEDVVLTNVVSFDVRVFDPAATVASGTGNLWRLPGDPGYAAAGNAADHVAGAYVDLGWGGGAPLSRGVDFPPAGSTALQSAGVLVAGTTALPASTYDTWSRHYEFNGRDEDGDGVVDEGVHGVDANGDGWPESDGVGETSAPYPVPLRGVEVRIRCYEPTSRQVRQVTIRQTFLR